MLVRGSFLSCSQQPTPTSPPTLPSQASPTVTAARAQADPSSSKSHARAEWGLISSGDNGLRKKHRLALEREEGTCEQKGDAAIRVTSRCLLLLHCFIFILRTC